MRGLAGKGVLVTGGTSGIGLATARRFLQEGARVFLCGLDGVYDALHDLSDVATISTGPADNATASTCQADSATVSTRQADSATASQGRADVGTASQGPADVEDTAEHPAGVSKASTPDASTHAPSTDVASTDVPSTPDASTPDASTDVASTQVARVSGTRCDVSVEDDVVRLVDEARAFLGTIDVLINNAGTAWREPFLEITAEHWDRLMAVNLRGMFLVAQAVSREMVATGTRGAIVNMSSTNGLGGEAEYAHYNASKGGVLLLTRTMAVELGGHGIRVNAVCPGYIRTPLNASITPDEAFVAAYERDHIPLGRAGRAEEVAAAYAFLASDDASFVNGAELVIDGGQLAIM